MFLSYLRIFFFLPLFFRQIMIKTNRDLECQDCQDFIYYLMETTYRAFVKMWRDRLREI